VKPISPHTIELVESLHASPGLLDRWLRRVGPPPASALDEIVASGELEAALGLLTLGVAGTPHYREPLFAALDRLVRPATASALVQLEMRARTLSEWRREGWAWSRDVTPERARSLPASPASMAGIASLHNSGYVREAAVQVLLASDDPLAVAFLLIRANDWVAPVRSAARRGLEAHLSRGGATPFVPYLELVDRLVRAGRNDLRPLADAILAAIAAPDSSAALSSGCGSESRFVRRRCYEIAFSARTFDLRPLILAGFEDADPVVRILAAKGAATALSWEELEPLVGVMLARPTPACRYSALDALWRHRGVESRPVQERFALDPHSHVRGTARWFLKTLPGFDGRAFYRAALGATEDARELVGAIGGLAEVGAPEDAAVVEPYLRHPRARVRAAAVSTLGAIGSDHHRESLIGMLSDPSARVCRASRQVLLRGAPVDPERLVFAALQSRHPHEQRAATDLAAMHDHWVAALLLLRIAHSREEAVVARAGSALLAWESRYNKVFTQPSRRQSDEFVKLLDGANVDEGLERRLRALVPALRSRSR